MPTLPRSLSRPVRRPVARYAVAFGLFGLGLAIRQVFDHALPPGFPYLTFFPAVIMATFLGGRGPGIFCAVLSGLAAWYWYIPPYTGFILNPQIATALLFYAFVVTVDILLIDGLQQRQERLLDSQHRLEHMARHQTLLFKELQHRVANNLASIASMLRLQRRQIERDPSSALQVIDRADERIELMGRVHRQLYDPVSQDMPVSEHIARVVAQAHEVIAVDGVEVRLSIADVTLELHRLMTVVLLLSELLANSFKHAFPEGEGGHVDVTLERIGAKRLRLTVADNGCGMPGDPPVLKGSRGRSLGTAIIAGLALQLNGTVSTVNGDGLRTAVEFPED